MDEKVDVMMGREAVVDEYIVSIGLNLNYVPAQWQFQLLVNDPHRGRLWIQGGNDNGVLVLKAPIDANKEDLIHQWIIRLAPVEPKLRPWTTFQGVLEKVRELQQEETKAREGHEFVKQHMAKKKAEQDPPQ